MYKLIHEESSKKIQLVIHKHHKLLLMNAQ